jgi:hypothetical protein
MGCAEMKEQVVQKILEYMAQTEDFVLEQLPDVNLQALRYERITAALGSFLMAVLFFGAVFVAHYFWGNPRIDKNVSREIGSSFGVMIPCMISPVLLVQLCLFVDRLIKIYAAPKYFLVQLFLTMKR